MQKREAFYAELTTTTHQNWIPAPREYSTLTFCNRRCYLIGGLNYDANKEVAQMILSDQQTQWRNMQPYSNEKVNGRCRHSSCAYNDLIYTFGGCFMYNKKRQVRECNSQVIIYDTVENTYNAIKTKGISIQPRKDHSAAIFGKNMIVYGGLYENGGISNEMLNFDL